MFSNEKYLIDRHEAARLMPSAATGEDARMVRSNPSLFLRCGGDLTEFKRRLDAQADCAKTLETPTEYVPPEIRPSVVRLGKAPNRGVVHLEKQAALATLPADADDTERAWFDLHSVFIDKRHAFRCASGSERKSLRKELLQLRKEILSANIVQKKCESYAAITRADNSTARVIEGTATTNSPDRMGDIVESSGCRYSLPIPLLMQHRSSEPVGQVVAVQKGARSITAKMRLATAREGSALEQRLDDAYQQVKLGLIKGLSIGFRPLAEPGSLSIDPENFGITFHEWEFLELSLVTIPANAEAVITSAA